MQAKPWSTLSPTLPLAAFGQVKGTSWSATIYIEPQQSLCHVFDNWRCMFEGWASEGFLKVNYWLCEIINKAQNLNFNQSSLIGCLGLNLDFVIAFFALTKHHQARFFFGSWLLNDNWKILPLYACWLQQFLADEFNAVSQNSVRQANTCHLWISCTALTLFSAPIFWRFFDFFYHKKVSQYYIQSSTC